MLRSCSGRSCTTLCWFSSCRAEPQRCCAFPRCRGNALSSCQPAMCRKPVAWLGVLGLSPSASSLRCSWLCQITPVRRGVIRQCQQAANLLCVCKAPTRFGVQRKQIHLHFTVFYEHLFSCCFFPVNKRKALLPSNN